MQKKQNNGYLVVASKRENYYKAATYLIESVKDYYPEANVTLVTEERFINSRAEVADNIIHCDDHYRAKLWGMTQTPYDLTFYMDADMECVHEDIQYVFEEKGDDNIVFTPILSEDIKKFETRTFPGGEFKLCGAVCLYDNEEITKSFIQDWWDYYYRQRAFEWWPEDEHGAWDFNKYPDHLRIWDQFTLFWLSEKEEKYKDLKIGKFKEQIRWNHWGTILHIMDSKPTVLRHFSAQYEKKKQQYLNEVLI